MRGLMMDWPLLISTMIEHGAQNHADAEIVSRSVEGPIHRTTYAEINRRAKQAAKALMRLDVGLGDRVATLAWNGYRHVEIYYAISGIGSVCHTVGTPSEKVTPSSLNSLARLGPSSAGPGITSRAPDIAAA